jgi:hypothetical protein
VSILSTGSSKYERARSGPQPASPPRYLDVRETAAYWHLSPGFMAKLRVDGSGPRFIKAGGKVLYDRADLDAWLHSLKVSSTTERHFGTRRRGRPPKPKKHEEKDACKSEPPRGGGGP